MTFLKVQLHTFGRALSAGLPCAGSHVLDEAERSLHDALCVLSQTVQDARVVYGGGFPEMQMAKVTAGIVQSCSLMPIFPNMKIAC